MKNTCYYLTIYVCVCFHAGVSAQTKITASSINSVVYSASFQPGSTTCGILEAYNALPSNGGTIVMQNGNCSGNGWPVVIQKPILLVGQGMGGPIDPGTNATCSGGSVLLNTSTSGSFFTISLSGTSLEGVTMRDFCMLGNKAVGGATSGDCVDINGGTTAQQVRAISFQNLQCIQPKGSGWVIKDNAFIVNFLNVHTLQSGSHCYVIKDGPNSGVNSQIHFLQSTGDLCGGNNASFSPGTADGINISGSTSREVDISQSTFADSNNGINIVSGAVNVNLYIHQSNIEANTTCDISLNDGFGHKISSNTFRGDGIGARGICTNMPAGAATQAIQLNLDANNFSGHTVQDVTIGANQKTCVILPEATNIYTYTDNSGHCVRLDVNTFGILSITGTEFAPSANGVTASGDNGAAWSTVFTFGANVNESSAPSSQANRDICYGDSSAHALECSYNNGSFFRMPQVIASGTANMTTAAITGPNCGSTVTVSATGVTTSDTVIASDSSAPNAATNGPLVIKAWPTANNVNFAYCVQSGTFTPSAATLNWKVMR